MANAQSSSQKDPLGNMLSAEAKVFVPRQQHGSTDVVENGLLSPGATSGSMTDGLLDGEGQYPGQHPVNGLPGYITTCYPFVSGADPRYPGLRAGTRGKHPMMAQPHMQNMHTGGPRNRFPHPAGVKNFIPQGPWGPAPGHLPGVIPSFPNMPSGMPFDGGTYPPNGFIRPPLISPAVPVHDPKSFVPNHQYPPTSIYVDNFIPFVENHKLINGVVDPSKLWNSKKEQESDVSSKGDASTSKDCQKICLKDSSIQTEFPDSIANSSLADVPNTLFNTHHRQSKNRSNKNIKLSANGETGSLLNTELEEMYASVLGRKNLVSNGTNTYGEGCYSNEISICMTTPNHVINYVKPPFVHSTTMQNSVPENFKYSYASVAQSKPSQKNSSFVSMATKSDTPPCDKNVNKKTVKHGNVNLNNVNVNVACIIKDLESAQEREKQEVKAGSQRLYTWTENQTEKLSTVSSSVGMIHAKTQSVNFKSNSHVNTDIPKSQSGNDLEKVQSEGHDLSEGEGQNEQDGQTEGQTGKKKRKRKRRRKKKNVDGENDNEDANSGANEEVTLHFEDEEEFPDLLAAAASGGALKSSPGASVISYSDVLKNTPVQQEPMANEAIAVTSDDPITCSQNDPNGALVKESRNSRKRRKRREVANKAADAEMAEISLEQHMLELKMKQKQVLVAKKSVSPVRNVSPQRAWKAPINQTSSVSPSPSQPTTVKKVSLLLPATVATEPSVVTARPTSPVAKQPGILKISAQPQNIGTGGKKSGQPIAFDLGAMIDALEQKKEQTPLKKEPVAVVKKEEPKIGTNPLDSSAPSLKRGKERETPRVKKHSPLKKVILKEREEKKRLRMLDEEEPATGLELLPTSPFPTTPISAPVGIGVVSGESDLSQDAIGGNKNMMMEVAGLDNPASAELSPISQPSPSCLSPLSPGPSPMGSGGNSPVTGSYQVKLKIHSRRFREYCNQILDKEIDTCCTTLLSDLVRFQDRQYHKDPVKAKAKRRIVLGLREVTKHLKLRKIKCVIISPNLEKIQSKGGLDEALNVILDLCSEQEVPFVFALGRRALGRACAKLVPVSVVGVFSYEGSEENFKSLVDLTEKARESYREMIAQIELEMKEYPPRHATPGVPHVFSHYGHSRTPSGCSVLSFTSSILSEPISENYPYSEPETDKYGNEIVEKSKPKAAGEDKDDDDEDGDEVDKNVETGYEGDDEENDNEQELNDQEINLNASVKLTNGFGSDIDQCDIEPTPKIVNPDSPTVSESDNVECNDIDTKEDLSFVDTNSDNEFTAEELMTEEADTIEDLPNMNKSYIDSIYDLNLQEILSQQSSTERTVENMEEVLSNHSSKTTHSSRTFGDSSVLTNDKKSLSKVDIKNAENSSAKLKGKSVIDKKSRTLSWVQETQHRHFQEELGNDSESKEETEGSKLVDAIA